MPRKSMPVKRQEITPDDIDRRVRSAIKNQPPTWRISADALARRVQQQFKGITDSDSNPDASFAMFRDAVIASAYRIGATVVEDVDRRYCTLLPDEVPRRVWIYSLKADTEV